MQSMILSVLEKLNIADYLIRCEEKESTELFFIKKKLDMRRICNTTLYRVTVYRSFMDGDKEMRGFSEAIITPGMDEEELTNVLGSAYSAAAHVKNPTFALYEGHKEEEVIPDQARFMYDSASMKQAVADMTAALFAADTREDSFLNSAELFIVRNRVHIQNSTGTDVAYTLCDCNGEFVVQCKEPKDVEQYVHFSYDFPDTRSLTQKVADALETVCDRANASQAPKSGNYDVVLYGEHLRTIMSLYMDRANASMVYPGYSDYKPGTKVQGEDVTGEKLNMTLVPSEPYSYDGIPMKELPLIKDGELTRIYGGTRFCRYLGIEPTGYYRKLRLAPGSTPFDQLTRGCLYPVVFSDFQMDAYTGYFGGEIRLAYLYHEDGTYEILTGGSINGSLLDKHQNLTFSKESYHDASYEGPFAVRIPGVAIAGI